MLLGEFPLVSDGLVIVAPGEELVPGDIVPVEGAPVDGVLAEFLLEGAVVEPEVSVAEVEPVPPELFWLEPDEPELSQAASDRVDSSAAAMSKFLFIISSPNRVSFGLRKAKSHIFFATRRFSR